MIRLALTLAALAGLVPVYAQAQDVLPNVSTESRYGCRGLETAADFPVLEGEDGAFFRRNLNVRTNHPLTDEAAELVGAISRALEARGTTLIYLPVPSKALAMPDHLPPRVAEYGHDQKLARHVYDSFVEKLREHGVLTVDALTPLLGLGDDEETAFVKPDFHWSSHGARAVAREVAAMIRDTPKYVDLPKTRFKTRSLGLATYPSEMRRQIQEYCRESLPQAETEHFETLAEGGTSIAGGIFASEADAPPIALVGTSMSATPAFNFEGFLAEASELPVANHSITGGNQFGAMVSYLMSEHYRAESPQYLIWENPIYNNIGELGELRPREILAAVDDNCDPLDLKDSGANFVEAELSGDAVARDLIVRADSGARNSRRATFDFATKDGLEFYAVIERSRRFEATRWFYQFVEPLWQPGIIRIRAEFDQTIGSDAGLALCTYSEEIR